MAGDASRLRPGAQATLAKQGVEIVAVAPDAAGGIDPRRGAGAAWRQRPHARYSSRAAARIAASLLRAGLVDRLVWMRAPLVLGGDGIPAIAALGRRRGLPRAPRFELMSSEIAGGM